MKALELRDELRNGDNDVFRNRRLLTGLSLVGIAAMTPIVLLQMGITKHLPDPPIEGFNSDKVNLSKTAFGKGTPDGALSIMALAANIVLAGIGGANRAEKKPWAPIGAAVKATMGAGMAGMLFYKMGWKLKAWCGYCITGAAVNSGIFLLSLPEAKKAVKSVLGQTHDENIERPDSHVLYSGDQFAIAH